ncbi:hypothetical protein [Bacillus sp. FJAT-27251]|uniref:hypothetical protein n=1 Tax=Bacillus sp. FJAT-27251 TaxID=1684142 RepID=UPI0012E1F796|nr:hypothetical protein [Bacillus sp. FJAT-27251]
MFHKLSNRRIPDGTYGGVRGRGLITPSYSIVIGLRTISNWNSRESGLSEIEATDGDVCHFYKNGG